jgi:hypothetical protein
LPSPVGIRWLLANHRPLIDAEFALNEGGRVGLKAGKPVWNSVQVSEKVVAIYKLEAKDKVGHSSLPTKENPIHRLAEALARLAGFEFPFKLNDRRSGLDHAARAALREPVVGAPRGGDGGHREALRRVLARRSGDTHHEHRCH